MLVRYLKAQAMVLLCGGLVGPIFLAVYFFSGQDELLKWMFWAGLLVTAVDVLVALGLVLAGLFDSGLPRWAGPAGLVVFFALTVVQVYRTPRAVRSESPRPSSTISTSTSVSFRSIDTHTRFCRFSCNANRRAISTSNRPASSSEDFSA